MSLLSDAQAIEDRLHDVDSVFAIHDRGQFYVEQFELTQSAGALLDTQISMFSGYPGGDAFAANYLLVDHAKSPGQNYAYSFQDIFKLSYLIASKFGSAVVRDIDTTDGKGSGTGELSIRTDLNVAQAAWTEYAQEHGLGNLGAYYPGSAIYQFIHGGPAPDLVFAANDAGFLFGKSVDDFQGVAGYQTVNAGHGLHYVVHYDSDRNSDGHIDFNDGVVVAVSHSPYDYGVGVQSTFTWPSNWQDIREWAPLVEFRQQLGDGGQLDFEAYFKSHGIDFWGQLEQQFDPGAEIRNDFYYYDRTVIGHNATDYLYGGKGADTLTGGGGDDVASGGWGNDHIDGGAGNDTLYDSLTQINVTSVPPDTDDDTIIGGSGDDHIYVIFGNDTIDGGSGNDTLDFSLAPLGVIMTDGGNLSLDVSHVETIIGSDADDTLQGFDGVTAMDGKGGTNQADFSPLSHRMSLHAGDTGAVTLTNFMSVVGSDFSDNLTVGAIGMHYAMGGGGNDKIIGGFGYDELLGGDGDDILDGGSGSPGDHNDLYGGAGEDTYLIHTGGEFDSIRDSDGNVAIAIDNASLALSGPTAPIPGFPDVLEWTITENGQAYILQYAPSIQDIFLYQQLGANLVEAAVVFGVAGNVSVSLDSHGVHITYTSTISDPAQFAFL